MRVTSAAVTCVGLLDNCWPDSAIPCRRRNYVELTHAGWRATPGVAAALNDLLHIIAPCTSWPLHKESVAFAAKIVQ